MPLTLTLLLAGCSSVPSSINPVNWWHDLQGGKIADDRPPPPGADQPYPNLASVPPKPEAPDRAAMANIASGLIADRTNAQHIAAAAPIADPSSPSASPALFGRGTTRPPPPPAPDAPAASATMPAAEAPPASPAPSPPPAPPAARTAAPEAAPPPARASVGAVQSAPLAPPGDTAQAPQVEAAPPPPLSAAPPSPPNLPGMPAAPPPVAAAPPPALPAVPVPSPPAVPPPAAPDTIASATPASAPSAAGNSVSVTFVLGSAALQSTAADTLRQLAARRGSAVIAVTGFGDATSNEPDAQAAALNLGLSRAQAMAAALTSAGVPASAVQVDATAIGRGGTARLVQ